MTAWNSRVLIVEDDVGISGSMAQFAPDHENKWVFLGSCEQALRAIHLAPWRVVSIDLLTPGRGTLLSTTSSLELIAQGGTLARKLVYTGFRTTEDGMAAIEFGGAQDFWVIAKGARNVVEGRTAIASPLGWCALMLQLMGQPLPPEWGPLRQEAQRFVEALRRVKPTATEPWQRSYWPLAARHLPQPLAEAAARYVSAIANDTVGDEVLLGREGLLALNDFREWTIWLAAAQTAVILRQQTALERPIGADSGDSATSAQLWIDQQLKALCRLPPQTPGALAWRNYLGVVEQPGSGDRGGFFFSQALQALDELRKMRNQGVHGLKPRPMAEHRLDMLPPVMDLASHWANNPLLIQVRREQGRWRAKALCGKEPVDRDLPEDLEVPGKGVDAGHVYQLVWRFLGEALADVKDLDKLGKPVPVLLDWWPYLRWHFNADLGVSEGLLLTRPERGGPGQWQAQGFSGTLRKPVLSERERDALTRPVG